MTHIQLEHSKRQPKALYSSQIGNVSKCCSSKFGIKKGAILTPNLLLFPSHLEDKASTISAEVKFSSFQTNKL